MASPYPVAKAIGLLEHHFQSTDLKEYFRALFLIYLKDKYPKLHHIIHCDPQREFKRRKP